MRLGRVKKLIENENIIIKNEQLYKELLDDVSDSDFETHVEALKHMAVSGEKFILETSKLDDGRLSVKTINETTGETSDDAEIIEKTENSSEIAAEGASEKEVASVADIKVEEKVEVPVISIPEIKKEDGDSIKKTEEKIENKDSLEQGVKELKDHMAKMLEAISANNKTYKFDFENLTNKVLELSKGIVPLKKKLKDLEDTSYNFSKRLPAEQIVKKTLAINDFMAPDVRIELFKSVFPESLQGDRISFEGAEQVEENDD